jgi:hypothetical protein
VNVLFTVAVLAAVAAWALTVYRRLAALRHQVKLAWKRLEVDQTNEAIKTVTTSTSRLQQRARPFPPT